MICRLCHYCLFDGTDKRPLVSLLLVGDGANVRLKNIENAYFV